MRVLDLKGTVRLPFFKTVNKVLFMGLNVLFLGLAVRSSWFAWVERDISFLFYDLFIIVFVWFLAVYILSKINI